MQDKADIKGLNSWVIVALIVVASATLLWPELAIRRVDLNDNVLHYSLIERITQVISAGGNPLDCWSDEWALGHPVLRTYQPLAHLLVAGTYFALGKLVPLMTVFVWVRFLSLVLLPLSFFAGARLIGFSRSASTAAALLAPWISTNFLYGVEYGSFTWAGSGLFPQAVATHLLLWAIGLGSVAIRQGRWILRAGIVVGLTALAHLIYGYMAAVTLVLLALLPDGDVPRQKRLARTFAIGAVALLVSAFQIAPLIADHAILNHSRWEPVWKWESFGAAATLRRLFTGELLDFGRLPVLTALAFAGTILWAWRRLGRRDGAPERFAAAGAGLWIAIYFGRPFWGPALTAIGISEDMHLHRVIAGAQIFLVLLGGAALSALWQWLGRRSAAAALAATLALLYPMIKERAAYQNKDREWGERTLSAYSADRRDLDAAIDAVKRRGGRAYAGLAAGWGAQFKIGDAPVYAFLSTARVPAVSFLYHSMALTGDVMVRFNERAPDQYRLFNIRSAIAPVNWPLFPPGVAAPRERFGRFQIYETPGGGYFDVVDAAAAVRTTRRNFFDVNDRWLSSDWPAKRSHLLLDLDGAAPAGLQRLDAGAPLPFIASPPPVAGRVESERRSGETYAADVEVLRASYVLFKMAWHPNWKAYVDGAAAPVVTLSPGFSAVAAAPGRHRVEFRYEPGWGKAALAAAGLLGLALAGFGRRRIGPMLDRASAIRVPRGLATAAGLMALAAPVIAPLMTSAVLAGHDAFEYFPRVVEAHRNVTAGNVLLRWAPDLNRGYGQPLFEFRPPLFYWVAELWHLAGWYPVTAVNLAVALLALAAAAAMYRLGRLYFGAAGGWLAAAAYLYAPYFAVDLYVRSAYEEMTALPLAALALYGFGAYGRKRRRPDLAIGACALAGLLACHFPAALLFAPLIAAFAAVTAWMARSPRLAAEQAAGLLLGAALGAWSWLPAAIEKQYVSMERLTSGAFQFSAHFVTLPQFFSTMWGYGLSVPGPNDGLSFSLGWTHVLVALAACAWVWRAAGVEGRTAARFFTAAAAVFCFLMLEDSSWLWEHLPLLPYVEFPWRMLGPVALCVAAAVASLAPALEKLGRWRGASVAALLALLIVPNLPHLAPPRTEDVDLAFWTPQQLAARGVETTTMAEVTPRWMHVVPPYDGQPRAIGNAVVSETSRSPFSWLGSVTATEEARLWLPFSYFPGWAARVDGKEAAAEPGVTGLVEVPIGPGQHTVAVRFGRSGARAIGEAISAAALVILALAVRRGRAPSEAPRGAETISAVG